MSLEYHATRPKKKGSRDGCLCLGPICDLAQVRTVDQYEYQPRAPAPAPNAERLRSEALVQLIEEAIARRERKLHESEDFLLPATTKGDSTSIIVDRALAATDADEELAKEADEGDDEADMTELLDSNEYLPEGEAAPAPEKGGKESRKTEKVGRDGGASPSPSPSPIPFARAPPRRR